MKKEYSRPGRQLILVLSAAIFFLLISCHKEKFGRTYTIRTPVFAPKSEVMAAIKMEAARPLVHTGKIYVSGKYIFLSEINKGIHVIDNSNPADPVQLGFLSLPGNIDIAVKGSTLYADFYADLLSFDISDMLHAKMVNVLGGVFPERYYSDGYYGDTSKVIIDWIEKDTTVYNETPTPPGCPNCEVWPPGVFDLMTASPNKSQGGSLARFSIVNDYLYAVDRHEIRAISLANPTTPQLASEIMAGYDIETIFSIKNNLILGSMGGLFIFDISDPAQPQPKGSINHSRACDPVVADDHYAFVTLRAGTQCGPANNELQVINIDDLQNPALIKTYALAGPKGLGITGKTLFICDGTEGLKVFEASDVLNLKQLTIAKGMDASDVILSDRLALVVATEGIFQFDITDPAHLKLLSRINTAN